MKKNVFIKMSIPVTELRYADGVYVIESPALELATQGDSLKQTRERFKEAVEIFFEELIDMNTLDEALEELGWIKKNSGWTPPVRTVSRKNEVPVNIPAYSMGENPARA